MEKSGARLKFQEGLAKQLDSMLADMKEFFDTFTVTFPTEEAEEKTGAP